MLGRENDNALVCALQIAVIMVLLARLVHWQPALAGVLTTVVLVPVTAAITRRAAQVRKRLVVMHIGSMIDIQICPNYKARQNPMSKQTKSG